MRIACPKCDFQPTPNILWRCNPGCGTKWHTFATHGVCPGCSKFWHDTQCPRCRLWSPIDDWYHEDVPDWEPAIKREQPKPREERFPVKSSGMIKIEPAADRELILSFILLL